MKINTPTLRLKKHEDKRILSGHLWIYSNEIDVAKSPLKSFQAGELVQIENSIGNPLGIGYINPHTLLCARLLTRDIQENIDVAFFEKRIRQALTLREKCFSKPFYRLIFGDSDFLPGVVVDRFNDILVAQITTAGMENLKNIFLEALINVLNPKGILWKNDIGSRDTESLPRIVEVAHGEIPQEIKLEENNVAFVAPAFEGQKTGWFYDHRQSRATISRYAKGLRVLDVFSYLGAFGIQAAAAGASEVWCVDSSAKAIEYVCQNAKLNQFDDKIKTFTLDAFDALKQFANDQENFDIVILDPPAFIKKRKDIPTGIKAYQKLNSLAVRLLKPNGLLLSASCSMHLAKEDLVTAVQHAGVFNQRPLQIIEQLHQSPDHPIHPAIPETEYLKGLIALTG